MWRPPNESVTQANAARGMYFLTAVTGEGMVSGKVVAR